MVDFIITFDVYCLATVVFESTVQLHVTCSQLARHHIEDSDGGFSIPGFDHCHQYNFITQTSSALRHVAVFGDVVAMVPDAGYRNCVF